MVSKFFVIAFAVIAVLVVACDKKTDGVKTDTGASSVAPVAPAPSDRRVVRVDGREIEASGRDSVVIDILDKDKTVGGTNNAFDKTAATGTGLRTESEKVSQSFKSEAPAAGPKAASGGGFAYSGEMVGGASLNVFHMLGAACLLGALGFVVGPMLFRMPPRLGTAAVLGAAGAAFIAIGVSIETMPYAWAVGGLLLVGVLGWWVWNAIRNGKSLADMQATIESTVATVSSLSPAAKAEFKKRHSRVVTAVAPDRASQVEATITKAKARAARKIVLVDDDNDPSTPPVPRAVVFSRPVMSENPFAPQPATTPPPPPPSPPATPS